MNQNQNEECRNEVNKRAREKATRKVYTGERKDNIHRKHRQSEI